MPPVQPGAVVAVTGAAGFIGSHVCAALLAAGYRVRAVVREPADEDKVAHLRALPGAAERLSLHAGNLLEPGSYDSAFDGADAVIHSAAVVEIHNVKDPEGQIVVPSVSGTKNILASADKSSTVKRFVHTSSMVAALKWDEPLDATLSEEHWNSLSSVANGDPYGFAKATAERLVLDHSSGCFDCVSILPGVNLGPCMTKAHTKSSASVVRQMLYGNRQGDYHGHFVDVRDTAAAHVRSLAVQLSEGDSHRFLAVGDAPMRICALGERLAQIFPQYVVEAKALLAQPLIHVPVLWRFLVTEFQRMMATQHFTLDNQRSKQILGLEYRPLDQTLEDTVKSMVDSGFVAVRRRSA